MILPQYDNLADRIIAYVTERHYKQMELGFAGASLAMQITNALEEAGLLEKQSRPKHNHFTPGVRPDECDVCETNYFYCSLEGRKLPEGLVVRNEQGQT